MKTHRSDFKHRLPGQGDRNEHAAGCRVVETSPRWTRGQEETKEERGRRRGFAARVRGAIGLTAGIVLILFLWTALTRPARTSPSPSWPTALSLAEEGAQRAILELQRVEHAAVKWGEPGSAGETPAVQGDRTFIYSNLRTLGEAAGSCYVTVSEEGPAHLSISSTGIVHDEYRTLAQRTLEVTARRRPLFESAVFARKGLFVAAGAEIEDVAQASRLHPFRLNLFRDGCITEQTEDTLSPGRPAQGDSEEERLPLLLPPWGLPSVRAVMLSGADVLTLSNSGVFPTVTLLDSSRLIIDDDAVLHIAGPLILRGESRIVIRSHVRDVSIYVDKDVTVEEGAAIINLTQSALSLSIVGMELYSRITLGTRETLYATVYAPNSEIRVGPGAYLRGGVCGDTVHVLAGTRMDYDERLASLHSPLRPFAVVSCIER